MIYQTQDDFEQRFLQSERRCTALTRTELKATQTSGAVNVSTYEPTLVLHKTMFEGEATNHKLLLVRSS